jgi:hypothetical protein
MKTKNEFVTYGALAVAAIAAVISLVIHIVSSLHHV